MDKTRCTNSVQLTRFFHWKFPLVYHWNTRYGIIRVNRQGLSTILIHNIQNPGPSTIHQGITHEDLGGVDPQISHLVDSEMIWDSIPLWIKCKRKAWVKGAIFSTDHKIFPSTGIFIPPEFWNRQGPEGSVRGRRRRFETQVEPGILKKTIFIP